MAKKVGIEIEVDSKGAIKSFKQIGKIGEEAGERISAGTRKANKSLLNLRNIGMAAVIAGSIKLAKSVGQLNDEYSLLRSQIRLVVDDNKDLASVQEELLQVANDTRQGFASTVKLYARLDRATEQLFLTDKQVIAATETLNKAIIISGASADESSAAIIQLSQGLASGALRGDELRSVLEQVPRVAKLIADGLGVTVGSLRELGTQGKLTAEAVIGAIKSQTVAIDEEFKQIEKTSGQTWTVLENNASSYITKLSEVNAAQGVFNSLVEFASEAFSSLDKAKTLEIAEKTEVENRTFIQQQKIFASIIQQKNKSNQFDVFAQKLLNEKIANAEKDLALILARDAADTVRSENAKRLAEEEAKAILEAQRIAQEEAILLLEENMNRRNEITNAGLQIGLEQYNEAERAKTQILVERLLEEDRIKQQAAIKETLRVEKQAKTEARIAKAVSDAQLRNDLAVANQSLALSKEVFGNNKAFSIAEIGLSTARGIMSALGSTPPNPILAGLIGVTGAVQAGKVANQKFADGGFVSGDGTGRSDSINASLSNGEFVVNAGATSDNRELLEAINNGQSGGGVNITINAGAGTDLDALAQAVTNGVERAKALGLEPQI
jgi:tape measure domain-containing protein